MAGCASAPPLQEEVVGSSLAPMPRPERKVGYKAVNLRNGTEVVSTLVEQTDTAQTWSDSLGCRVVVLRTGFAPVLETSNCEGNSVVQEVTLVRGTPYPLTVGSKWQYSFSGKDARGNQWSGQRHCAVEGTSRVKTVSGRDDTYKVVCQDSQGNLNTTYTYYVSPAKEAIMFQERYRVRNWSGAPPSRSYEVGTGEAGVMRGKP
jgi:hypothetical protein